MPTDVLNRRKPAFRDLPWLVLLIAAALVPRLGLILSKGFAIFHSDHAVFGLMAKDILEGRPMIYYYGQGYMGPLDSWMAALLYLIGGMNLFTLQLAPVLFYLLFLIANFFLLRRLFGFEVSLTANLLLAISPPALNVMCATLGGYPETFLLGSLILLGLIHFSESGNRPVLFLTGLAAGLALWTNNLILFYFLTIGILWFLRTDFWARTYPSCGWRRALLVEGVKVPAIIRWAAVAVHFLILFYLLWNVLSFFTGETLSLGGMEIKMASPPFHVKKLKKILLLIAGESLVLAAFSKGLLKLIRNLKPFLPLAGGFLLGSAPMILYSLFGGEGYRVIHGSGMIGAGVFPAQFRAVVWDGFFNGILGIPTKLLSGGNLAGAVHAWALLCLTTVLLVFPVLDHKKEWGDFLRLRPGVYPPLFFFYILIFIFLAVCLFSSLVAGRYLLPSYFAVAPVFALALARIGKKIGKAVWVLFLFLIASYGYANFDFISKIQGQDKVRRAYASILELLESRGVQGGYAHFVTSYVLTFQAREKIVIAAFRSPDRTPEYARFVDGLPRAAYIFQEDDAYIAPFQKALDGNRISYEKAWIDPFWIYLIERKEKTERGIV